MAQSANLAVQPAQSADPQVQVIKVPFEDTDLIYEATNQAVIWRANTLYRKEPDTVAWIKQFNADDVFIDIGANVGMYSILAAQGRGAQVYAFEPESQNFALLNRNILYNQVQDHCVAFPLALTDGFKVDKLYLSQFGLGGSCHTFGADVDFHLKQRSASLGQGCVSMSLDDLIADGVIPRPTHIKIDVDGLEHLVLAGARQVLADPALKSVLIELNTHLEEHMALLDMLDGLGFVYDQRQVDVAIRKQGEFAGIGNYIFYRPDSGISFEHIVVPEVSLPSIDLNQVKAFVAAKFAAVDVIDAPYPHFMITDLFPADYLRRMQAMKPSMEELVCINDTGRTQGYDSRFVMHLVDGLDQLKDVDKRRFWQEHLNWFCAEDLMIVLLKQLREAIVARGVTSLNVRPEAMFMRDLQGYSIGPHTDSPRRLLSMMIYLPDDAAHAHLGTSVYEPLQAGATCNGTAHHGFENFKRIFTAPYLPNSAFGFLKTDNSFHGVEPMQEQYTRDSLVYIVKHKPQAEGAPN